MARHQRSGSRTIYTHARPADEAFQLDLPGEAGLVPPPRAAREPSAWIVDDSVNTATLAPGEPPAALHRRQAAAAAAALQKAAAPVAEQPTPRPVRAPDPPPAAPPPPQVALPSPQPVAPPPAAFSTPPPPAAPALASAPDTARLDPPAAPPAPLPVSAPAPADPPPAPPPQVIYTGPAIDERLLAEATSKAASILADAERERLQTQEKTRAEAGRVVESARRESEETLEKARAEAAAAVEQAKREADGILEEARRVHENAHQLGHAEGFEAGQGDARAAAYAQMEEHVGDLIASIHNITQDALSDRHRRIEHMEPDIVALALEIAEKIIDQEIKLQPEVVAQIARHCISRVRDRQEIVLHANSADMETLQRYRDQFIRLEDLGNLRIVEDSRVGLPGGVLIETAGGEIDARVETQMERIRQEFQNVMEADAPPEWDQETFQP